MFAIKRLIRTNGLCLWCETFGNENDHTAILLIQGSGAQGLLWPDQFCKKLAENRYYVVRYDHRDTGRSSYVNYENDPYTLKDLTEDAKGVLDALALKKAHVIGSSMGGYIAQLLGIFHPEKVLTLTLMMTSPLSISLEHAFFEDENPFSLPLPTREFADALLKIGPLPQTQEGLIRYMLSIWSAYNGKGLAYDKTSWSSLAQIWLEKSTNLSASYHHRLAVNSSPPSREKELKNLSIPTLIVHGFLDPFFAIEHAYALQKIINSSTLLVIEKMGHLFHEAFFEQVANAVIHHLKHRDIS
jgi:pimeloyl-ACP methyl ester carboxylesterase